MTTEQVRGCPSYLNSSSRYGDVARLFTIRFDLKAKRPENVNAIKTGNPEAGSFPQFLLSFIALTTFVALMLWGFYTYAERKAGEQATPGSNTPTNQRVISTA